MTEEQYHIIEQYISNELEGEALITFEQQLLHDAEIAEAVQLFKLLGNEMPAILKNKPGAESLKKNLQQLSLHHAEKQQAPVLKIKKNNWYKLTAAAAILIAVAGIVFWQVSKNNKPEFYAQFIGHETISLTNRGNTGQDSLEKAAAFYNNKQYGPVIPLLERALLQDTANIQYRIILSRCYIETNNYQNAFTLLNAVAAGGSAYKYEAVWLTAMAWLKQNKNNECIIALQTIPPGDDFYIKAQQLIKVLTQK
ncbi:hypothetical protein BH11BAC6_BH11BAC6_10740 [soil metagenome]